MRSIYMIKVIVPQIILTAVAFSTFWVSAAASVLCACVPCQTATCPLPHPLAARQTARTTQVCHYAADPLVASHALPPPPRTAAEP